MISLWPRDLHNLVTDYSNHITLVTLYSVLIFFTSVFIYITTYFIYVPIVHHTKPVHLQFDTTCQRNCSFPYAIVNFKEVRSSFHLSRGQSYRFVIAMDLPESDVNWKQGMFMIRLRLIETQGKTLFDISRPTILRYKTLLTRIISTLVYWPFLITNFRNEQQTIQVQIIDNYIEGATTYFDHIDRAFVEIIARDIQIYSAQLHIYANLSGLSYYMYYWPVTSATLGILTIVSFMTILTIFRGQSASNYQTVTDSEQILDEESKDEEDDNSHIVDSSTEGLVHEKID